MKGRRGKEERGLSDSLCFFLNLRSYDGLCEKVSVSHPHHPGEVGGGRWGEGGEEGQAEKEVVNLVETDMVFD